MSSPPTQLQATIFTGNLDAPTKLALLDSFYPVTGQKTSRCALNSFEAYFNFFEHECRTAVVTEHAVSTYSDLIQLVEIVRRNVNTPLKDLPGLVGSARPDLATDTNKLFSSIELAIRLWLMIRVLASPTISPAQARRSILWSQEESLAATLGRHMFSAATSQLDPSGEFSVYMNVYDMHSIANFHVRWTNEPTEHLRVEERFIYIYQHVSLLKRMRTTVPEEIMPRQFIDETLQTINLLIPHDREDCNKWLQAEVSKSRLDLGIQYRTAAERRKGGYQYWRERLLSLSENFATARPSTLRQWWHDRRDMGQWWGFWLVITGIFLTVLFGLIQSVTGILQVVLPRE